MNTIRGRLIMILLLTQVVLIPPLLYAITVMVEHTMSDIFIDDARSYGQVFAAELSSEDLRDEPHEVVDLLDARSAISGMILLSAKTRIRSITCRCRSRAPI